jgi:hypothetical protein
MLPAAADLRRKNSAAGWLFLEALRFLYLKDHFQAHPRIVGDGSF